MRYNTDWRETSEWYQRTNYQYRATNVLKEIARNLNPVDHRDRSIAELLIAPLLNTRPGEAKRRN